MISTKNIVNKLNAKIANSGLTEAEFSQIHAAEEFLTSNNVSIQANTVGDLPDGPSNKGRMIYVIDEDDFYYYDGAFNEWTNDFTSFINQGDLYAFGFGDRLGSTLGTGDTISRSSPVTVAGGITNWINIAGGKYHSLGLTDTGVLYAWGNGGWGQLGTGNTINQSSPVTVAGGITNWSDIAAGAYHSLGFTDTGILYAWGVGSDGQLGTGNTISKNTPVTVAGGITNWSDIAAGRYHSFGLTDTGILYAWGNGDWGRLGTGNRTNQNSPVTVAGGITNWSKIAAGGSHSLGLTDTGILYAWGDGRDGRSGTNDQIDRSSPVTVAGGITNWNNVAAGNHSLGFTDTGILYAWGNGSDGKLGTGDTISRSSPVTVAGGITNWSDIAAGDFHSLGLTDTGILYAWGEGNYDYRGYSSGVLGTNDAVNHSSPVTVVGGITNWQKVSAGYFTTLAIVQLSKGFTEA